MQRIIYIYISIILLSGSCSKNEQDNTIPGDVPGMSDLQAEYTSLLTGGSEGWYIEYKPTNGATVISILMKFNENGTATITSDYKGYTGDQENVRYRIGGILQPELIFETYSVWQAITENIGGKFEFYIKPKEDGSFSLQQVNGTVTTEYLLRKAEATDKDNILAKAHTANMLQEFSTNASAYFKNLNIGNFGAFWELDPGKQSLRLTWENDQQEKVVKDFTYNYIPNGIKLNTLLVNGNISFDELIFGALDENELEIVSAGNAGAGSISVSHTPAFPYRGTANLFMRIENELPRFFAYTLDDLNTYYSSDLQPYIVALKNLISPERLRIQLYHYNMNATGTTPSNQLYSMQLLVNNAAGASVWLPYYTSLSKIDESHVIVTSLGTTNSNGAPYLAAVQEFMEVIFPAEGVTIVPAGRSGSLQKLRIISRKNSRIYFDIVVSTPTGIYVD